MSWLKQNWFKLVLILIGVSIAFSFIYKFVVRPIQNDKKLDRCLTVAGYIKDDIWYKYQRDACVRLYGENK